MKKVLSNQILPTTTAEICPQNFSENFFVSRKVVLIVLSLSLLIGFALRVQNLGVESFSEDELNKLQTVNEYRTHGLTGKNGEHPFLMKGLQTLSIVAAEKLNQSILADPPISEETALRFPTVVFGGLTIIVLFFLFKQLFGSYIGLLTAILWAVDPNAVGFNRIAKEDSFLLFFFLLGSYWWIVSQSRAEKEDAKWDKYVWLSVISFAGMMASKYLPHLLGIIGAYYNIFQGLPTTKWRLGKYRWLNFFAVMGVAFLIFNPTILLPETWRQMLIFSGEKRIGHDGYEFMGEIYRNQMSLWLDGLPWTFYYVFILVKTPVLTLIFGFVGLLSIFRRKFGDGRFFIFFWLLMWFLPFSVLGGKFVRYFTVAQPLILLFAAVGAFVVSSWIKDRLFPDYSETGWHSLTIWIIPVFLIFGSIFSSFSISPYFRLHTNSVGGGETKAGFYFPHDEFYDTSTAETVAVIVQKARPNAIIANETPYLFEHYFAQAGRPDLVSVSLSDKSKISNLSAGDFIIAAKGRQYFSNRSILNYLDNSARPFMEISIGNISSVRIYQLDQNSLENLNNLTQ